MEFENVKRGEVFWINFADGAVGHEPTAHRPYVVVSSDRSNETCPTFLGVNITTKPRWGVLNPEIHSTGQTSWANCTTVCCIDKSRLNKYLCTLTEEEMAGIDRGLRIAMSLNTSTDDEEQRISELEEENASLKAQLDSKNDETAETVERDLYKKLYYKALDELASLKMDRDIEAKMSAEPKKVVEPKKVAEPTPVKEAPVVEESKVEINTCSEADLRKIGCSPTMTRFIIEKRPYVSVDDLRRVPYMTAIAFNILKNKVTCIPVVKEKVKIEDSGKVNINTATSIEIQNALNCNRAYAGYIITHRNRNGKFTSLEELLDVSFLPKNFLAKYRDRLTLG